MRLIAALAFVFGLTIAAVATPPVPRPAKEFTFVDTAGKQTLLTSLKGKVVMIQFLFTWCQHCQATARDFTTLQKEFGARGLQVMGVAFDDVQARPDLVKNFVQSNNVGFPVTVATDATVKSYLGITTERYVVPQIMIIDRKGVIRAQSDFQGTEDLQKPEYLRPLIDRLLKEGAAKTISKATLPPK